MSVTSNQPDPETEAIFLRLTPLVTRLSKIMDNVSKMLDNADFFKLLSANRTLEDEEDRESLNYKINTPLELMQWLLGIMQSIQSGDVTMDDVEEYEKRITEVETLFKELPLSTNWDDVINNIGDDPIEG